MPLEEPGQYSLNPDKIFDAISRGEGPQALAYYERLAGQAEQEGRPVLAARADHAAAAVALRLGHFQKTIQVGTRSIELFRSVPPAELAPSDLVRVGSAYAQIGSAYRSIGDLARARTVLEEGLAFVESALGGQRENVAVGILSNALASVAYAQRDYQACLARATLASRLFEDQVAQLTPRAPEGRKVQMRRLAAQSFVSVARAELALGHPDLAEAAYGRALSHARLVKLRELELEILLGQGNLAASRKDWSRALALFQVGLPLATQLKKTVALVSLNNGQARALGALGRTDEALVAAREAVRYVENLRGELGDADLRTTFLDDKQAVYLQAVRLALKSDRPDEAFAFAERGRARAFLDLLGNQATLSKGRTRGLVDEEVRLRARLAEARAQAHESDEPEDWQRSHALAETADRDYRAFLERVRKENLEQASLMTVEPVTLPDIQGLLDEGTTLLEYLVDIDELIVWVIDQKHAKAIRIPGDRQSLVRDVREFRRIIASRAAAGNVRAQAEALYSRLLGPARGEIATDRIIIVPHGVLHYLPFGALRSPAGRWVVEEFALATVPSASVLRYLAAKGAAAPDRALVVGNPDLGSVLMLPWAEREARMVASLQPEATVLVGGDATEARVKKFLESVGLAHFATHGELNESDPLSSALLLVPGAGEDGRLEVREVFGLDLRARLVVLSACETGLGKLSRGDELVGLQRAFLYAGTPAVVTTLWKVDDRASYELIRAFYDRLPRMSTAEALRQAQRETMRAFPHPFSWAAFVLTGMPR